MVEIEKLEKILGFLHVVSNLKSTLRWTTLPSGRKESTAEHSWRLALMTFLLAEELSLDIDILQATKIALVHDLAEEITGDFCSWDVVQGRISKAKKQQAEKEAMTALSSELPATVSEEIYLLWQEYEQATTDEAKFVKALDKLEFLSQLAESGSSIFDDGQDHAMTYADKSVTNFPALRPFLRLIKHELKAELEKNGSVWKKEYDQV